MEFECRLGKNTAPGPLWRLEPDLAPADRLAPLREAYETAWSRLDAKSRAVCARRVHARFLLTEP